MTAYYRDVIRKPIALAEGALLVMEENEYKLFTVKETAVLLKLNSLTVYEYIRSGKLNAVKLGRYYRIMQSDLVLFLNAHKTTE